MDTWFYCFGAVARQNSTVGIVAQLREVRKQKGKRGGGSFQQYAKVKDISSDLISVH